MIELAPGKVNLSLYVGRVREDGYHPLVSVVQPVSIADEIRLEPAAGGADEVVCPGVEGPNLAGRAIELFRAATGWEGAPVRILIDKRVPIAAGMGGGSGDAAATLRLLARHSGHPLPAGVAAELGADVPSQIRPGRCLMAGVGERITALPEGREAAFVIVRSPHALSTPAVYREFDRLGLGRPDDELEALEREGAPGYVNDLEPAARSLCPWIDGALARLGAAGARTAMVSGSGPTVFGIFGSFEAAAEAARATGGEPARRVESGAPR